ncbi:MAG: RecX family transcriptional regulator, partial [Candidatus Aminicenantes bacterium]|nr:RecX family transcriptional regulator [Candidatus Aminicenantes bacterium]
MTEETSPKSYAAALKLLSIRARSQAEMQKLLEKKAFSEKEIATTIRILKEKNYLDDFQFAYQYSLFSATNRLMGRHRLFQKL